MMPSSPATAAQPRRARAPLAFPLLLLLAAAVTACGPAATASPDASSTPPSATTGPTATQDGAALPAGFPIMPGAMEDPDPPTGAAIGAWHTDAASPAVYEYYLVELPRAGFAVDGRFPGGAAATIILSTPSGEQLQLAIEVAAGGGTDFQLLPPDPG